MSFHYQRSVLLNCQNTLDYEGDALTLYLIGPQSTYTPNRQDTSLATARGDEISVGGYFPVAVSVTIVSIGNRVDLRLPSEVSFGNLSTGVTVHAALLGRGSGDVPLAWFDAATPTATTGGEFKVLFDDADYHYTVA